MNLLIVDGSKMTSTFDASFLRLKPILLLPAEVVAAVSHLVPAGVSGTGDDAAIFAV